MSKFRSWVLVDVESGVFVDSFSITGRDLGLASAGDWSVRKRTLRGGLADGVELMEVDNGAASFAVAVTRGMGIWRGQCQGTYLGWQSPVRGPVHPKFVRGDEHGGIGWLQGFDEWIVRCGLNSNGAPGKDVVLDNNGNAQEVVLPLHGRIANIPAHYVEVRVSVDSPARIEIVGVVDEAMLFFPQLRLETTISTVVGAKGFSIHDRVVNLRSQPAELQLLYHCNFGPPLLGQGSRFLAPIARLAPRDQTSAEAIASYTTFPGPKSGVIEEAFFAELIADGSTGRTLAVLQSPQADRACALRFSKKELPWFTLWRNPGALSDGYVTGLEPGTNLPNAKRFERERGRVVRLPAGGTYSATLDVEVATSPAEVEALGAEVRKLQSEATLALHRQPTSPFT